MGEDVAQLLKRAGNAIQAGQTDVARRSWEQVLRSVPHDPVALNGLGMLALQENCVTDAAGFFLKAASSAPSVPVLWLNHAKAARLAGDDPGEKESLLRAAEIDPLSLIVRIRLAEHAERTEAGDADELWRSVVSVAANMTAIPIEARGAVEHARAIAARQTTALSDRIDAALAPRREEMTVQQRRRIDGAIDYMFGRRTIYLNQCSGLHIPFLPADEYFDNALLPWLTKLEAATETIRSELVSALREGPEGFEPYVSLPRGTPTNVWTALDNSTDWSTLHLWRHGQRDDAICQRFPKTAAVIDSLPLAHLPGRMPTVFFSMLAPRAHIPAHTGVTNARAIIHLPLIVPEGCRFRVGGETRPWVEGEALVFDDTIEHEAWNDSDEPRVVLILDSWNPHLTQEERALLVDFYAADESKQGVF